MLCQNCSKNQATVHVTEIRERSEPASSKPGAGSPQGGGPETTVHQKHLCESCAQELNLPFLPVAKKSMADIWKLLQQSAQRSRREAGQTCGQCGMSLGDFRVKGRLGCPDCYETFRAQLEPLLLRIHNATEHAGRLPGIDEGQRQVQQRIRALRKQLEDAIREEAYEAAAKLRDELQSLEAGGQG